MENNKQDKVSTPLLHREGQGGGSDNIAEVIMNGITFRGGAKKGPARQEAKVKTKAKKKQYITGAHGSGSAKQKAKYREQRANRKHR